MEKLIAVGLSSAHEEEADGREARVLSLTAEVYRTWLKDTRPYSRQREEGVKWE